MKNAPGARPSLRFPFQYAFSKVPAFGEYASV